MAATHVFISYSRRDTAYAERMVAALTARDLPVWIDHSIQYGTDWSDAIFDAIHAAAAVIVLMSADSRASKWVRREVAYADEIGRPIFPMLIGGEPWPLLLTTQHVDARTPTGEIDLPPEPFFAALSEQIAAARADAPTMPVAVTPQTVSASSESRVRQERKLETAMPACTRAGADSQVRVRISLPDSVGLSAELPDFIPSGDEIHKSDVRASGFSMDFPARGGRLQAGQTCIAVRCREFEVVSAALGEAPCPADRVLLDVPPDADSRTVIVTLAATESTPQTGTARVFVTVYQTLDNTERVIAESALSTRIVAQIDAHPACELWKLSLAKLGYGEAPPAPRPAAPAPQAPPILTQDVVGIGQEFAPEPEPMPDPDDEALQDEALRRLLDMEREEALDADTGASRTPPPPPAQAPAPIWRGGGKDTLETRLGEYRERSTGDKLEDIDISLSYKKRSLPLAAWLLAALIVLLVAAGVVALIAFIAGQL